MPPRHRGLGLNRMVIVQLVVRCWPGQDRRHALEKNPVGSLDLAATLLDQHLFLGLHNGVLVRRGRPVVDACSGRLQLLLIQSFGLQDPLLVQDRVELWQCSVHLNVVTEID